MTNTQRVDVARLSEHWRSMAKVKACPSVAADMLRGCADDLEAALPALLQQLAERAAEVEALRHAVERSIDAQRAAERAREECVRLAEKWERISSTHGVRCFTGDDHLILANELRVALGQKPAAFLAANGGA